MKASQICNYWNGQAWDKYKACQENIVRHTGGGDGDEDWYSLSDSGISDVETDAEESGERRRVRCHLKAQVGGKHSRDTLLEFMHSEIYSMIHKVYVAVLSRRTFIAHRLFISVRARTRPSPARRRSTQRGRSQIPRPCRPGLASGAARM